MVDEEKEPEEKKEEQVKDEDEGFEVLDVFGMKIKVNNPQMAKLLTLDVNTDIAEIGKAIQDDAAEHLIDTQDSPIASEVKTLDDYFTAVDDIGREMGFSVETGGFWKSALGVNLLVKPVFEHINYEKALIYAEQLASQVEDRGSTFAGLFVMSDQIGTDIFKAAIREKNLYNLVRVISYDNLYALSGYMRGKYLTHQQVVGLLVPIEGIDAGELLNIIKALSQRDRISDNTPF